MASSIATIGSVKSVVKSDRTKSRSLSAASVLSEGLRQAGQPTSISYTWPPRAPVVVEPTSTNDLDRDQPLEDLVVPSGSPRTPRKTATNSQRSADQADLSQCDDVIAALDATPRILSRTSSPRTADEGSLPRTRSRSASVQINSPTPAHSVRSLSSSFRRFRMYVTSFTLLALLISLLFRESVPSTPTTRIFDSTPKHDVASGTCPYLNYHLCCFKAAACQFPWLGGEKTPDLNGRSYSVLSFETSSTSSSKCL